MNPPGKKRWSAAPAVLLAWFAWSLVLPALAQGPLDPHQALREAADAAEQDLTRSASRLKEKQAFVEEQLKKAGAEGAAAKPGDPAATVFLQKRLETAQASLTAAPPDGPEINGLTLAKKEAETALAANEEIKKLTAELPAKEALSVARKKELADAEEAEKQRLKTENEKIYEGTLALLTMFLVLAIVLENALEVIFKWRVFQARYSNRGMKAPIMVIAAGLMVLTFKLDILANLVALYKSKGFQVPPEVKSNFFTGTISAFVLAGGSAGVNRLMVALGVRKESPPVIVPKPPDDKAWIAIKLNRVLAVGDLLVHLDKTPPSPPPAPAAPGAAPAAPAVPPNQLAGVIRTDLQSAREIMLRNKDRFPQNGGCEVDTVSTYKITVTGTSADGTPLKKELGPYSFAPGAIVDFNVTL